MDELYYKLGSPKYFRSNKYYSNILSLLGVKYIILRKDLLLDNYYQERINDTRSYILNWKDVSFIKNIGKLEIYQLDLNKTINRVHLSGNLIVRDGFEDAFTEIASSNFDINNDLILLRKQNKAMVNITENCLVPNYHVIQKSKTRYSIQIEESSSCYWLVLSNNFSNNWIAQIDNQAIYNHFTVNGYANGWFIEKKGSYTIEIVYKVWPWE